MNAVGIDVSKGRSTVAVVRPFGEVVRMPFDVLHTASELGKLASYLRSLDGETRIVMEFTGKYYEPIAHALHEAGLFVSVVNPILIKDYGNNTIRRAKTDAKDALKIANYTFSNWMELQQFYPEDELRRTLKVCNRQYGQYMKVKTMLKNNLISLLDQTFPGINELFTSPLRSDGSEKWVDFVLKFWHCECITSLTQRTFSERYAKWCRKHGYYYSQSKAEEIYIASAGHFNTLPMCDATKTLVAESVSAINAINGVIAALKREMTSIASKLPEYNVVLAMHGVGETLAPQLIAEIGDVRRFEKKSSLVCFAGVEPPENASGAFVQKSRSISKQGPPALRKALFQVMSCVLQVGNRDEPIFQFLDRKRSEGKPYRVYMVAGMNKFLRIYYARVKACLDAAEMAEANLR